MDGLCLGWWQWWQLAYQQEFHGHSKTCYYFSKLFHKLLLCTTSSAYHIQVLSETKADFEKTMQTIRWLKSTPQGMWMTTLQSAQDTFVPAGFCILQMKMKMKLSTKKCWKYYQNSDCTILLHHWLPGKNTKKKMLPVKVAGTHQMTICIWIK